MIVWWMSNTKESRYVVSGLKPILRIKSNPGSIALLLLAFGIGAPYYLRNTDLNEAWAMMDNTDMPFTRDVLLWFLIYFYNSGQPFTTLRPAHFYLTGKFFCSLTWFCSEDPKTKMGTGMGHMGPVRWGVL